MMAKTWNSWRDKESLCTSRTKKINGYRQNSIQLLFKFVVDPLLVLQELLFQDVPRVDIRITSMLNDDIIQFAIFQDIDNQLSKLHPIKD